MSEAASGAAALPRVVMLLPNPFEVDSRVLKEARSAAGAGFEVTILCTPKSGLPSEEMREGFKVRRLEIGRAHV